MRAFECKIISVIWLLPLCACVQISFHIILILFYNSVAVLKILAITKMLIVLQESFQSFCLSLY